MQPKVYENKCLEGKHPRILVTDEFIERNRLSIIDGELSKHKCGN